MSDMGSYYQCSDPDSNEKNWTGQIRPLNINRNEFEVTARGSTFHLLVGKHAYGKYLCIPNWGIGTEISSLSDCFWNRERLEQDYPELSKVDTRTNSKGEQKWESKVITHIHRLEDI